MSRSIGVLIVTGLLAACTADDPLRDSSPSAPPSSSATFAAQVGLTERAAEVRIGILNAAEHGDYEMLRPLLEPEVFLSDFGFGSHDEPDPITRWADMGDKPLRIMAALLQMSYEEEDTNEGRLFRWPIYDAETKALSDMSGRDRNVFRSLLTRSEFRRLVPDEEYGYVGPRLGILADGIWWFFILEPGP
ncbi:MAG: hypothetical protein M3277_07225 [Actinomycetota bacterium]|nr:hypothetical protein [Actinomycetota bacterium]